MPLNRRLLLASTLLGAPVLARAEITPQQFGARGDPESDTRAWNEAAQEAAQSNRPLVAKGTYILRVRNNSRWNWWQRPTAPTHIGVRIRSGLRVQGDATILVAPPDKAPNTGDARHFLFGTDLGMAPDAVRDVSFEGLTFDFRDEFGPLHTYTYAFGAAGITNFTRRNLKIISTGKPAGRGLLCENAVGRNDSGLMHRNIIQGIYTRYERDVTMRDIAFDNFVEGLDFDGPAWNVRLSQLRFRNGRIEGQCIDSGGGTDWLIDGVEAENTGNIFFVYVKDNSWPTYAEWLRNDGKATSRPVRPERIVLRNVVGRNAGKANAKKGPQARDEAIRIGNRVPQKSPLYGHPGPSRVTLENITLDGGGQVAINDCEDVVVRGLKMARTPTADDPVDGAALVLRQGEPRSGGRLSGKVEDVRIEASTGMGVSVVGAAGVVLDRVSVEGYGTANRPQTKAGVRVRKVPGVADAARIDRVQARGGPAGGKDRDE